MDAIRLSPVNRDLLRAARAGDGAASRRALAAGADPKACDRQGRSAMRLACAASSPKALHVLLAAGETPLDDKSAMVSLLQCGHVEVFEQLMREHPDKVVLYPGLLHLAATRGHLSIVAGWPSSCPWGSGVIWKMVARFEQDVPQAGLDALWERFPIPPSQKMYDKILDYGVVRGRLPKKVREAITSTDIMAVSRVGSRLRAAAARGHVALLRCFVERMASEGVTLPDEICKDLCFMAARYSSRALLHAISSFKGWDEATLATLRLQSDGGTLLHEVLGSSANPPSRIALVRLLLAHGADLTAADQHGFTPLHCAAQTARQTRNGGQTVIDILDAAGASWDATTRDGNRPLELIRHGALATHWRAVLAARDIQTALDGQQVSSRPTPRSRF